MNDKAERQISLKLNAASIGIGLNILLSLGSGLYIFTRLQVETEQIKSEVSAIDTQQKITGPIVAIVQDRMGRMESDIKEIKQDLKDLVNARTSKTR